MKTRIFTAFLAGFLAVSTFCFAAEPAPASRQAAVGRKVMLKLRLKAGEKRDIKITQIQNITQTMQGKEIKTGLRIETVMGYEILAVEPNGMADMEVTYKSMKVNITSPQGTFVYDSTKPAPDTNDPMKKVLSTIYSSMTGGTLTMKVKPDGEVSDVNGMAAIIKKVAESAGPEAEIMKKMMSQMFDEKKMKDTMGQMFAVFPDEPVSIGQAWYDNLGIDIGFPIDVSTTYILKKRENGLAYIDAVAKMDIGDTAKKIELQPGMEMSFQMAGAISQSLAVDEISGWAVSGNGSMNLTGTVIMEPSKQMPKGMTIPMKIDGTFKFETLNIEK